MVVHDCEKQLCNTATHLSNKLRRNTVLQKLAALAKHTSSASNNNACTLTTKYYKLFPHNTATSPM